MKQGESMVEVLMEVHFGGGSSRFSSPSEVLFDHLIS